MSNECGEKILEFLRDKHEQSETPESCDVDYLLSLISLYDTRTSLEEELIEKIRSLKCDKKLSLVDLGLDQAIESIKQVFKGVDK